MITFYCLLYDTHILCEKHYKNACSLLAPADFEAVQSLAREDRLIFICTANETSFFLQMRK